MAKDNNYPTSDVPPVEPVGATGDEQPAEDPLVELARIVNRNRQPGAGVGSDRVGQTDYFAGLEDLGEPAAPSGATNERSGGRVEPTFNYGTPTQDDLAHTAQTVAEVAPHSPPQPDVDYAAQANIGASAEEPGPVEGSAFDVDVQSPDDLGLDIPESTLESGVSLDLENSLTAELEDELIGAFRQNFDVAPPVSHEPVETVYAPHVTAEPSLEQPVIDDTLSRGQPADYHFADTSAPDVAPVEPTEEFSAALHVDSAQTSYENLSAQSSFALDEAALAAEVAAVPDPLTQNVESAEPLATSLDDAQLRTSPISEDDLFAELGTVATVSTPAEADSSAADPFDNLFADLQPPSQIAAASEPAADDIDDMAWPAAAAAVPAYAAEDETPPPPEGYDLDAVAKAMQESDPTLGSAGVLPPHTKAEKAAAPQQEASRKGLYAAAAVLAVAVVGGGVFMFMDGSAVTVPDGPPPVIAGLEGPLKVYPDAQPETESQTSKLIYDRVGNVEDSSRERLVLPENTRPAELPPAPEGVATADPLVPGAPKKVRTLVVRPDGTIVSAPDTPAPRTVSTTPVAAAPVTTTQPDVTTPVAAVPTPAAATQPEPTVAAPDLNTQVPGTPAIVATPDETSLPVQPADIPTILPKKKPAAPVQVASAPQATTQSGPLNLNSSAGQPAPVAAAPQAAAPAPAVSTSSGSIPAGTYVVQVTSQRSETAARDAYSSLQQRYPSILGSQSAVIVSAAIQDRGTFYRARIPMGSRAEALSLCESLQAAGGDCFVRRN